MVLEYLPTKLGHFWGFYVGVYIPAPWFASGLYHYNPSLPGYPWWEFEGSAPTKKKELLAPAPLALMLEAGHVGHGQILWGSPRGRVMSLKRGPQRPG